MTELSYLLPPEDIEFLEGMKYDWHQCVEGGKRGLVISGYQLPRGYTPDVVDLMLLIPTDYPIAGIDMFYFSPGVTRSDRSPINKLRHEDHFDKQWQRWSRHPIWRPGIDSIATHITYVGNQLRSELGQGG